MVVSAAVSANPELDIVIVTWNNKGYLEPCLRSLYEGGARCHYRVIIVDNGSADGTQALLRERFSQAHLIQNERNEGLSRASNQGIAASTAPYVLLLNDDTLVNGPALDALVDFMAAHPEAGAVGARLLNPDGTFQAGYAPFPSLWQELLIVTRLGALLWPNYPSPHDESEVKAVGWIGSACLLLRRQALDDVRLLDEEYFIYGDEADLQYRLHEAGWQVYYLPQASIVHYGGRSLDRWRRRQMVYRGKILFFQKHYEPWRTLVLRLLFFAASVLKLLLWALAWVLPKLRERAKNEVVSNLQVLQWSLRSQLALTDNRR